jgi:hypothetical protein
MERTIVTCIIVIEQSIVYRFRNCYKKGVGYFTDTGMTVIGPSSTDFKQLQTT